jgi:hypothetical protein
VTLFGDLFKAQQEAERPASNGNGPVVIRAASDDHRYATVTLARECEMMAICPEGSRNDRLNHAAFKMGRHIGAGTIARSTVEKALRQAGLACGLSAAEVDIVLRDEENGGINQGMLHPRHPPERDAQAPAPAEDPDIDLSDGEALRKRFTPLNWLDLWADDTKEEWILEPLLPARRLVALFSPPKVGKSLLMLEIAVGIACGTAVLGQVPEKKRVLYVYFENDPKGDIRTRLQAMDVKPQDLDDLVYLSYPALAWLDTPIGGLELLAVAVEYEADVVVIDTISRAVSGEENANDTWLNFYRNTGVRLKAAGIACIRLDHTGKDQSKGMRGGSAKYGDVDAVWSMKGLTEDTFELECTANRLPIAEKRMTLTRETDPLRHKVAGNPWAASVEAVNEEIIRDIDRLAGKDARISASKAQMLLIEDGCGRQRNTVQRAVKARNLRYGMPAENE